MSAPELYITNFNKNFTGVSATAAAVAREQMKSMNLRMVGHQLPGCPPPISKKEAFQLSRDAPDGAKYSIWHVRRNPEMRAAIWARDVLRRPIKIVFTSSAQRLHSAYPRWLISKMDAVIATTEKAAEFVPNVKAVIPHGVDTNLFKPAENRAEAWKALGFGGEYGIVTAGRIRPEKGTDRFVEAMIKYLPHHPTCHALIVGKATREHQTFLTELKSKISQSSLTDRFHFTGECSPQRMAELLRACSLLIALPRYEGYGVTPLEALASGTPFIGTDVGGFRGFSDDGKFGKIIGRLDPTVIARDWMSTISDLKNEHSEAMRTFVETHFSSSKEASEINAIYRALRDQRG